MRGFAVFLLALICGGIVGLVTFVVVMEIGFTLHSSRDPDERGFIGLGIMFEYGIPISVVAGLITAAISGSFFSLRFAKKIETKREFPVMFDEEQNDEPI